MASTKAQPARQMKRDYPKRLRASLDPAMMKQIQATHTPDNCEVEVKPIVHLIEEILRLATPSDDAAIHDMGPHIEAFEQGSSEEGFHNMLEALAHTIHKISCEISCKCSGGGDAHATTLAIFSMLSSYSWDAKVVLSLAAFAANYGDFWLVIQLRTTFPLAKSVALLKQFPDIKEDPNSLKPRWFVALKNLIIAMLDATKCIVEFKELPSEHISQEMPPMSIAVADIPTAVYWIIRSIVACASHITALIGTSPESITWTKEAWELSSLADTVSIIHSRLKQQLADCHQHIEEKKQLEIYNVLVDLFAKPQVDNWVILTTLFCIEEDTQPLLRDKAKAKIEELRRKTVLLLISDLDLLQEELVVLKQIYVETRLRPELQYEIVWLPVLDSSKPWNEEHQKKFEELQSQMPWYTLQDPCLLKPGVSRYIKGEWHFTKKAILVVLDRQGKVVCQNALHMMWIWRNSAFPFTTSKEESLWKEETWRLEFLVDSIDATINNWINEEKYVCLYGGENLEWIQNFIKEAKVVADAADIKLEMLYVGKSNARARERARNIINTITSEKLHCWTDFTFIWLFWTRLESMLYSKSQLGQKTENDPISAEVQVMLTYDASDQGWAVIGRGRLEITKATGEMILRGFKDFDEWKDKSHEIGFIPALDEYLRKFHTKEHCNRLILPGIPGGIPENVVCAECRRPMEKYFMYRCCTD